MTMMTDAEQRALLEIYETGKILSAYTLGKLHLSGTFDMAHEYFLPEARFALAVQNYEKLKEMIEDLSGNVAGKVADRDAG